MSETSWTEDDPCAEGCDPNTVIQVASDEDLCLVCGLRGPIGDD